jgi:hypothetical protein
MTQATSSRSKPRDLTLFVVLFFTVVWALFIHSRAYSDNDTSRMATIESLVHRGTWAIDDSPFTRTVDRIKVGEHFYSSKPPVLSFVGAGVYYVLHNSFGFTLQATGCEPDRIPTHCRALLEADEADWAYFALTLLLSSSPATLILAFIYRLARKRGFANGSSLALVLTLGLGTALFPFSTIFLNQVPSAAGLFVAFYVLLTHEHPTRRQLFLAGFCATLAATIDLSAGAFLLGLFIYVALRHRSKAIWFMLGGIGPALLTVILDYHITNTPLPPHMYPQGYNYEGSFFKASVAGHQRSDDVLDHAYRLLVGDYGVLAFYPITLVYLYALGCAVRSARENERWIAWTVAGSTLAYVAYFALFTNTFGGLVYSPRWLLNPVPLLALFAVADPALYRPRWRVGLVGLLAIVSVVSAYKGALNPWQPDFPIFRLEYKTPEPRQHVAVCISGYVRFNDIDATIRQSFGFDHVERRWFDARHGFVVPHGPAWWFVHESSPLPPELADPLGLDGHGTYSLYADLAPTAERWLDTFQTDAYSSPALVPQTDQSLEAVPLPVTLDEQVTLLGYWLHQSEGELVLITAWRIEARRYPVGPRRVFVHLLAPDGGMAQQSDLLAATFETLYASDLLFQVQRLPLEQVPAGEYWLQVGMYNPDTMARLTTADGHDRLLLTSIERSTQ